MKSMRALVALSLAAALSGCGAKGLTEPGTREFVQTFEAQLKSCDMAAVDKLTAPTLFLIQDANPAYNMRAEVHQRNDAISWLRAACKDKADRDYTYQVQELKVLDDETASVKLGVDDTYTRDGHKIAEQSGWEYMIKWVDKAPKVASIKVTQLHATYDGNAVF